MNADRTEMRGYFLATIGTIWASRAFEADTVVLVFGIIMVIYGVALIITSSCARKGGK